MSVYTKLFIERYDAEIEVEVRFDYHPGCRGARDSCGGVLGAGPPLEPDEPPTLEFIGATAGGVEIELTQQEQELAEEQAWDEREDAARDYDDED